jgi:hypothetical protein
MNETIMKESLFSIADCLKTSKSCNKFVEETAVASLGCEELHKTFFKPVKGCFIVRMTVEVRPRKSGERRPVTSDNESRVARCNRRALRSKPVTYCCLSHYSSLSYRKS